MLCSQNGQLLPTKTSPCNKQWWCRKQGRKHACHANEKRKKITNTTFIPTSTHSIQGFKSVIQFIGSIHSFHFWMLYFVCHHPSAIRNATTHQQCHHPMFLRRLPFLWNLRRAGLCVLKWKGCVSVENKTKQKKAGCFVVLSFNVAYHFPTGRRRGEQM